MPEVISEKVAAEELLKLPLLDGESREAVEWIADHMEVRRFAAGETIIQEGDSAREFIIVLEGSVLFRRVGVDEVYEALPGQATGILPFSRMKTWAGRGWAPEDLRIGVMDVSHHREMVYRAPVLAQRLVSQMTDRAREFTRMEEGNNRLLALGRLAAGLAHELNNPASAAVRSSVRLRDVLNEKRKWALALRGAVIPQKAAAIITELSEFIGECAPAHGSLDTIERSDRESDMADWLDASGLPCELASGLVDADITVDRLRPLANLASGDVFAMGLRILVADHEIICLTRELEEASRRMSDLVQAVKSYSYMDQSPIAEVDIEQGIDVTLRMFQHQLKQSIQLTRRFSGNLPRIHANGSALNQIWTNLIDNAICALESLPNGEPKTLSIRTCRESGAVLVEVADNGPGIPPEVKNRIFEPFFTTKPVGVGTGLGLDIVQRIVRNHKGSIRVDSAPGRTVFQVRLPLDRD
jgi:signal transduction histidine kinase